MVGGGGRKGRAAGGGDVEAGVGVGALAAEAWGTRGALRRAAFPFVVWAALAGFIDFAAASVVKEIDSEEKLEADPTVPVAAALLLRGVAGIAGSLIAEPGAPGRGARLGALALLAGGSAALVGATWEQTSPLWVPVLVLGIIALPLLNLAAKRLVGTALPVTAGLVLLVQAANRSYGWTGPNVAAPLFYIVALHQALFNVEELLNERYAKSLRIGAASREDAALVPRFEVGKAPNAAEIVASVTRAVHVPVAPRKAPTWVFRLLRCAALVAAFMFFSFEVPASECMDFVMYKSSRMRTKLAKFQMRVQENPNDMDAILMFQSEMNKFTHNLLQEDIVDYMVDYTGAGVFNNVYEDHYGALGLQEGANKRGIKKAFRTLSLTMHPDKHPNDKSAAARFAKIQRANDLLTKPASRIDYKNALGQETIQTLVYVLMVLKVMLPITMAAAALVAPGSLVAGLWDSVKTKVKGGDKKGEDIEEDFKRATAGRALAAAAEARLVTGECRWWAQQLAHAEAADAAGLGGGSAAKDAQREFGNCVKAAGLAAADATNLKSMAEAEVKAALQSLKGSTEAHKALWEARVKAETARAGVQWARAAALIVELRGLGVDFAGAAWSRGEEAATVLAAPAGDAAGKAMAEGVRVAARGVAGAEERRAFLVASLNAFQHRVGQREKSFVLPKLPSDAGRETALPSPSSRGTGVGLRQRKK